MIKTFPYVEALPNPIAVLEEAFKKSGLPLIQTAFKYSYFIDPERVRELPVKFPDYARTSKEHHPGIKAREYSKWRGREIRLDGNSKAQAAWKWYSGRNIERGSGYGVRHIWGNPWNPDAFTAGWNLCYMPYWAGMLTEDQHPHLELQRAIQQASYDLFFRENPVCSPLGFIKDPGVNLSKILGEQPILILKKPDNSPVQHTGLSSENRICQIRKQANTSWVTLLQAAQALQGRPIDEFRSGNVASKNKSLVKKMLNETGYDIQTLAGYFDSRIQAWRARSTR